MEGNFDFSSYFHHLLQTKKCVDVTFILQTQEGDVEYFAHQMVLAMRSPYFADMFYGDKKEKENKVIRLGKINSKAFEDMIRYCYDSNPDLERFEDICSLFKVAYRFKVMSLMNTCRTCLMDIEMTPGNVFSILEVSESMEGKELRDSCCQFLGEKTKDVMESYEMSQVTPAMVRIILDLRKLSLNSEIELIKWLIDWANANVEEGDIVCDNAREYLDSFLQDMNFLALTFEEFAMLCKDYPDFFTSEEIACICLNIAHPGVREMPDWFNKEVKIREYYGRESRAKLKEKDITEERKCITDILAIEEGLIEFLNYISDSEKSFKEKRSRLSKQLILNYYICNAINSCKNMRKNVMETLKTIKSEDLETFKKYSISISKEIDEQFNKVIELLKDVDDGEFARMQQRAQESTKLKSMEKKGKFDLEFDAMRNVLKNLDEISESYKDDSRMNESLKKCRPMVIEKIKKLSEFHDKFQEKFSQLLEEKLEIVSK